MGEAKRTKQFKDLFNQHIEKYLSELPLKDHMKEWKVIWHSSLEPIKGNIHYTEWDLKLYTSYDDSDGRMMRVVIGVKLK